MTNKLELQKTWGRVLTLLVVMSITWALAMGFIVYLLIEGVVVLR